MVTAIVMIDVDADSIAEAAQTIADLPGVDQVYSCAGDVDLVAIISVADHAAIAELVPGHISKVPAWFAPSRTSRSAPTRSGTPPDAFSIGLQD